MKRYFYFSMCLSLFIECSNKQNDLENIPFIPMNNRVGQGHNDGLVFIFANLDITPNTNKNVLKNTSVNLLQQAVTLMLEYIRQQAGEEAYMQAKQIITEDKYREYSADLIKTQMTFVYVE